MMMIIALLMLVSAPAQASTDAPPFSAVTAGYVALSVANLDASAEWYRTKLSLRVVKERGTSPDGKATATILAGAGLIVELIHHVDATPHPAGAAHLVRGFFKAGIVVNDLDAALRELERRHVTIRFRPFTDEAMGYRTFAIADNEGNIVQFFGK
jgi:catechol 2,3-dioxygenase-like lactoylglutathione lyase family enzyme